MSKEMKRVLSLGVAGAALLVGMASAQAGSFQLREQSAEAMGMGFAGVAAGTGGLSSMFWNPATITDIAGWQSSSSLTGVIATSKTSAGLPGTTTPPAFRGIAGGDIGQSGIVPSSYYSYQFNDSLWFALSINAPYGLTTKNAPNFAGGIFGQTSHVTSTNISPTIAYKINDWISVAAGLQAEYFNTRLTSVSPNFANDIIIQGNSWGYGYTLGTTIKPVAGTEIGVGYRSRVKESLNGSLTGFPNPAFFPVVNINSKLTLPDVATIGIKQQITDKLTLAAGFEWTHWSLFKSFPVVATSGPAAGFSPTSLAFRYRNGYYASLGGSYKYTDALTLRAGLGYERSPITDTTRGVRLPDNDRILASIGAGYKVSEKLSLDFSYAHVFFKKSPINITSTANPSFIPAAPFRYVGTNSTSLDIISLGMNYRWDDPKVAIAAPLVRKF